MPHVPGLRSPYVKVGRLVYFGRMLDKIRLHAAGKLPADYLENLGDANPAVFDGRCCRFLGIGHAAITERVLDGESDEAVLAWAHTHGTLRSDDDCMVWNAFMCKRGWRDDAAPKLAMRIAESGFEGKPIATMFDYLDFDEGRDPASLR